MKSKFLSNLSLLLLMYLIISCDSTDEAGQPIDASQTTFEIIANSEDHNELESLLISTDLDEALNSGIYTVFAPTDTAFENLDLSNLPTEELRNLLLNHVLSSNAPASSLTNGYIKTNATETFSDNVNFIDMYINVDGALILNGVAEITLEDLEASNGTVHVVDNVISLPTIVDLISVNPRFSNLVTALEQENLVDAIMASGNTSPAPYTVFAPNNLAFDNLIAENPTETLTEIEDVLAISTLEDILSYHILTDQALRTTDLSDGLTPNTFQGSTLTINQGEDVTITDQFSEGRETNIINADITASNGVIHILDNVLLID